MRIVNLSASATTAYFPSLGLVVLLSYGVPVAAVHGQRRYRTLTTYSRTTTRTITSFIGNYPVYPVEQRVLDSLLDSATADTSYLENAADHLDRITAAARAQLS